jgi:hypothetical protein
MELLDGLGLPGVGTGTVDINELHRLVNLQRHGRLSLSAILQRLGITAEVFRQACEEDPTPRDPRKPPTPTVTVPPPGPAYQKASSVLTPPRLLDLYETEGRSLCEIGEVVGVCKQTIAELARDYGITIKRNGRGKYAVDPEWLLDQHVNKGRSLSQISRECGVSVAFLAGLAHRYRVPVRKPSRYSATALMANKKVPKTLIPALVTQGGWERLQRLPVIAQYESLAGAARVLGTRHVALGLQVSLVERDLGGPVLIRATQHTEQRLTPLGQKVVAAVHTLQARGGPSSAPDPPWCAANESTTGSMPSGTTEV